MSVPPLRIDGTLPPGEHRATLAEILAAFPATTGERQALNSALQGAYKALKLLQMAAPDVIVYIDGSYTTRKPDPVDIDILVLTDSFDEDQVIALLARECPIEATYLDVHADRPGTPVLKALFTQTRKGKRKGIILLDL